MGALESGSAGAVFVSMIVATGLLAPLVSAQDDDYGCYPDPSCPLGDRYYVLSWTVENPGLCTFQRTECRIETAVGALVASFASPSKVEPGQTVGPFAVGVCDCVSVVTGAPYVFKWVGTLSGGSTSRTLTLETSFVAP